MERPPVISDCFEKIEKTNICYVPKNHQYKPEPDSVYSKPIPGMVGPFIGFNVKDNGTEL